MLNNECHCILFSHPSFGQVSADLAIIFYQGPIIMTTMTISTITNSHDPKNKKSLSHLWQEIEKKQQRNARYQAKLDDFYVYFKKRAEEDEQSVCFATETWITHLLSFIPRKTIKGAQRESLYVWIEEEISILESNPFNPVDSQPLRKAFMEATLAFDPDQFHADEEMHQEALQSIREELQNLVGDHIDISDEQVLAILNDPDYLDAWLAQTIAASDVDDENDDEYTTFNDDKHDNTDDGIFPPQSDIASTLYSDKQLTKLYRQLAKQLHPDRELDGEKKSEKIILMQQLSQAKKNKDPIALLLMAQQYLPDHEIALNDKMLKQLSITLKEKITTLNAEYNDLQCGVTFKSLLWQKFGKGNKQSREKELSQYCDALQRDAETLCQQCHSIRTVKQLQHHLRSRIENDDMMPFFIDMDPDMLFR